MKTKPHVKTKKKPKTGGKYGFKCFTKKHNMDPACKDTTLGLASQLLFGKHEPLKLIYQGVPTDNSGLLEENRRLREENKRLIEENARLQGPQNQDLQKIIEAIQTSQANPSLPAGLNLMEKIMVLIRGLKEQNDRLLQEAQAKCDAEKEGARTEFEQRLAQIQAPVGTPDQQLAALQAELEKKKRECEAAAAKADQEKSGLFNENAQLKTEVAANAAALESAKAVFVANCEQQKGEIHSKVDEAIDSLKEKLKNDSQGAKPTGYEAKLQDISTIFTELGQLNDDAQERQRRDHAAALEAATAALRLELEAQKNVNLALQAQQTGNVSQSAEALRVLQAQLAQANQIQSGLTKEKTDKEGEYAKLFAKWIATEAALKVFQTSTSTFKQAFNTHLKKSSSRKSQKASDSPINSDRILASIDEVLGQLNAQHAQIIDDLKRTYTESTALVDKNHAAALAALQEKQGNLDARILEIDRQNAACLHEKAGFSGQLAALQAALAEAQANLLLATKTKDELTTQIGLHQGNVNAGVDDNADLKAKLAAKQQENAQLLQQLQQKQRGATTAQSTFAATKTNCAAELKSKLAAAKAECERLQAEAVVESESVCADELKAAKAEYERLQAEADEAAEADLNRQLATDRAETQRLQNKIDEATQKLKDVETDLNSRVADAQAENKRLQTEIDAADATNAKLSEQLEAEKAAHKQTQSKCGEDKGAIRLNFQTELTSLLDTINGRTSPKNKSRGRSRVRSSTRKNTSPNQKQQELLRSIVDVFQKLNDDHQRIAAKQTQECADAAKKAAAAHQAELESLKIENTGTQTEIQAELAAQREKLALLEADCEQNRQQQAAEIATLQASLAESVANAAAAALAGSKFNDDLAALVGKIENREQVASPVESKNKTVLKSIANVFRTLNEEHARIQQQQRDSCAAAAALTEADHEKEIQDLKAILAGNQNDLTAQLAEQIDQIKFVTQQMKTAEYTNAESIDDLKTQLAEAEAEVAAAKALCATEKQLLDVGFAAELDELVDKINGIPVQNPTIQAKNKVLTAMAGVLQKLNAEHARTLAEHKDACDAAAREREGFYKTELAALRATQTGETADAAARIQELADKNDAHVRRLAELSEQTTTLETDLSAAKAATEAARVLCQNEKDSMGTDFNQEFETLLKEIETMGSNPTSPEANRRKPVLKAVTEILRKLNEKHAQLMTQEQEKCVQGNAAQSAEFDTQFRAFVTSMEGSMSEVQTKLVEKEESYLKLQNSCTKSKQKRDAEITALKAKLAQAEAAAQTANALCETGKQDLKSGFDELLKKLITEIGEKKTGSPLVGESPGTTQRKAVLRAMGAVLRELNEEHSTIIAAHEKACAEAAAAALEAYESQIEAFKALNGTSEGEKAALEVELKNISDQNQRFISENSAQAAAITKLEASVVEARAATEAALASCMSEKGAMNTQLKTALQGIGGTDLDAHDKMVASISVAFEKLKAEHAAILAENSRICDEAARKSEAAHQDQLKALESARTGSDSQLRTQLNAQIQELADLKLKCNSDLQLKDERITAVESELAQSKSVNETDQLNIERIKAALTEIMKTYKQDHETCEALAGENKKLDALKTKLEVDNQHYLKQVAELKETLRTEKATYDSKLDEEKGKFHANELLLIEAQVKYTEQLKSLRADFATELRKLLRNVKGSSSRSQNSTRKQSDTHDQLVADITAVFQHSKEEVDRLKAKMEEQTQELRDVKDQHDSTQSARIKELETSLSDESERNANLTDEIKQNRENLETLYFTITETEPDPIESSEDFAALSTSIALLYDKSTETKKQVSSFESSRSKSGNSAVLTLQESEAKAAFEIEGLNAEIRSLQGEIEELKSDAEFKKDLPAKIQKLESELAEWGQSEKKWKTQIAEKETLEVKLEEAERTLATLRASLAKTAENSEKIVQLEAKIEEYERALQDLQELKANFKTTQQYLAHARKENGELHVHNEEMNRELKLLKKEKMKELETLKDELTEKHTQDSRKIEDGLKKMYAAELKKETSKYVARFEEEQSGNRILELELQEVKTKYETKIRHLQEDIYQYQAEKEDLKKRLAELLADYTQFKKNCSEHKYYCPELIEEVKELKRDLRKSESDIKEYQDQLVYVVRKVSDFNDSHPKELHIELSGGKKRENKLRKQIKYWDIA